MIESDVRGDRLLASARSCNTRDDRLLVICASERKQSSCRARPAHIVYRECQRLRAGTGWIRCGVDIGCERRFAGRNRQAGNAAGNIHRHRAGNVAAPVCKGFNLTGRYG